MKRGKGEAGIAQHQIEGYASTLDMYMYTRFTHETARLSFRNRENILLRIFDFSNRNVLFSNLAYICFYFWRVKMPSSAWL